MRSRAAADMATTPSGTADHLKIELSSFLETDCTPHLFKFKEEWS
jgi:hypothetical protein